MDINLVKRFLDILGLPDVMEAWRREKDKTLNAGSPAHTDI
jgi:hypothetical protein